MREHVVSGIVFYDPETLDIYVQERDEKTTKWEGELYSFFGGGVEEGETPKEAMLRELQEEINYVPEEGEMEFLGQYSYVTHTEGKYKGMRIVQNVFLAEASEEILNMEVLEGKGFAKIAINRAIEGDGFVEGSTRFLTEAKDYLENKIKEGNEGKGSPPEGQIPSNAQK